MLRVHLAHYHIVLQLCGRLCLAALKEHLRLLKAALLNRRLLHGLNTIIEMFDEGPGGTVFLEEQWDFVEAAADKGSGVDEVTLQQGVSVVEEHGFIGFAPWRLAYISEVQLGVMGRIG